MSAIATVEIESNIAGISTIEVRQGPAGPNSITTATASNLTGFIAANGTNVSGATAGATAATPSTVVLRDAFAGSNFAAVGASSVTSTGTVTSSGGISTSGFAANIYTTGQLGFINTSGNNAQIYTSGTDAHILTQGVNAYIQSRSTFKLYDDPYTTTLSHSPTANRAIAFPNDAGTLALTNPSSGSQTFSGAQTFSGQVELTGQAATTANSAMTRSLVEASFSNPITQGGTIIQVQATALSRSTLLNGGNSLIPSFTYSTPRVACTTTLNSSAVLRATANDGITTRVDSSNRKLFADKYGWFFIGYLGARGLGSRGKVIIGGNSTPAEMIVEGTLGSNGIALESYPLVANTPRFRLVVRNGATTTVGAFSGTGVYSIAQLGQWWIVMESGTTSAYYRLEQGAWNLICSVAAVPASSTVVSGNGIAIVAYTPDAAATAGSTIQLNIIYETFGITPD